MIERIGDLPDHVVGFTATGKVTGEDYETVLVPAIEECLKRHERVRVLYQLGEGFDGFEAAALWDDAKVGLRHFTAWERIAVVTDVDWIRQGVKVLGFVMPGSARTFQGSELAEAREWIVEDPPRPRDTADGLRIELIRDKGILVLEPDGPLEASDFERAAGVVDPWLEQKGTLQGILIRASSFPGWQGFSGFTSHLRFVRGHHEKVRRVAVVTDHRMFSQLPRLARHFVSAEILVFPTADEHAALAWLEGDDG